MTEITNSELFDNNPLGTQTTIADIKENFEFLDDWEDRYGYVIDLGRQSPVLPPSLRVEENFVHGCQSQVWFVHHYDEANNRLLVIVDSDAMIVKGLAAVVMAAFNTQTPQAVASFNMEALFQELDLLRHLSPTRGNGLRSMVEKIQSAARSIA